MSLPNAAVVHKTKRIAEDSQRSISIYLTTWEDLILAQASRIVATKKLLVGVHTVLVHSLNSHYFNTTCTCVVPIS